MKAHEGLSDRDVYLEPLICHWQDHIGDDVCHVSYDVAGHSHQRAVLQSR